MMRVTHTRTYVAIKFANPYLSCSQCGKSVKGYRDDNHNNYPCNHVGITDNCVSWSPVDGCTCKETHG